MRRLLAYLILALVCLFLAGSSASAQTTVFTENFDSDFSQWQPLRDDGQAWQIINGQADVYLETPHTLTEMVPQDSVWSTSWQNLEYELDYIPLSGVDRNISFGVQSVDHWYEIHFVEEFFNLVKVKAGQKPFDINHPFRLENGQSYRLKIIFHTGLIQVWVDDRLIAEEYDASFNQDYGKIGIKVTTGDAYPTHVRFDNIRVRQITDDGKQLTVPQLKQHDPQWAEVEYDHASSWSDDPSFRRWACALTSMVMIMQYHGLTSLPNGQVLTPITLNQWLLTQPDGYLGEGLINWIAVTRLTKLISQKFNTPTLEFQVKTEQPFITAISELTANRPVIAQIPGHFLVATGYTGNKQDLYINDPFYEYPNFFAHQVDLQSLRTFIPSHTDLSYLVMAHDPELKLTITDTNGNLPQSLQTVTEYLRVPDAVETTQTLTVHYLAKPQNQKLQLKLQQATTQPFSLTIFAYDATGELTNLSQQGLVGNKPLMMEVNYRSDSSSHSQIQASWSNLQQQLWTLHQTSKYLYSTTFLELDAHLTRARTQNMANQLRYISFIESKLASLKPSFEPATYDYLTRYLTDLSTHLSRAGP